MMYPVLFQWGPLTVYTYGFFVALGVMFVLIFIRKTAQKEGWEPDQISDLIIWFAVVGFIGARIFYVVQNWNDYAGDPVSVFKIWEGGVVFYGGLISGILFLWFYLRWKKRPFLNAADLIAPYIFLGHGFGRIGCFFNGCCYGRASGLPWAVYYPFAVEPVHPAQLYSAVFHMAAFLFLYKQHQHKRFDGETTFSYLVLYGVGRFMIEYFRGDNAPVVWGINVPQIISLALILSGLTGYGLKTRKNAA